MSIKINITLKIKIFICSIICFCDLHLGTLNIYVLFKLIIFLKLPYNDFFLKDEKGRYHPKALKSKKGLKYMSQLLDCPILAC